MAKVRETVMLRIDDGNNVRARRGDNPGSGSRNGQVDKSKVNPMLLKDALSRVGGDIRRLRFVSETEIVIDPKD